MLLIPPSLPLVFVLSYPSSFNQPPYFQCPVVTGVSRELPRDRGSRKTHLSPSYTAFPTTFINPFESCKQSIHWTMNTPKTVTGWHQRGNRMQISPVLSPESWVTQLSSSTHTRACRTPQPSLLASEPLFQWPTLKSWLSCAHDLAICSTKRLMASVLQRSINNA